MVTTDVLISNPSEYFKVDKNHYDPAAQTSKLDQILFDDENENIVDEEDFNRIKTQQMAFDFTSMLFAKNKPSEIDSQNN